MKYEILRRDFFNECSTTKWYTSDEDLTKVHNLRSDRNVICELVRNHSLRITNMYRVSIRAEQTNIYRLLRAAVGLLPLRSRHTLLINSSISRGKQMSYNEHTEAIETTQ